MVVMENHKGTKCIYRDMFCQEGYCSECGIKESYERMITTNNPLLIYVSAPYSKGDVTENVRRACMVGNLILAKGHIPFVPHLSHLWHIISPKTYQEWLDMDFAYIYRMDALIRVPGDSSGADREVALAEKLGIPVYYSLSEIREFVG